MELSDLFDGKSIKDMTDAELQERINSLRRLRSNHIPDTNIIDGTVVKKKREVKTNKTKKIENLLASLTPEQIIAMKKFLGGNNG